VGVKASVGGLAVSLSDGLNDEMSIHASGTTVHSRTTTSSARVPIRPGFIAPAPGA
jgi:hypothetical protein